MRNLGDLLGKRVLVVEDEAMVSMMLELFLEELGCMVVATASRLDDALEKANTLVMDVAVLDVNLAGQLSFPVAEVLRGRGIPLVFATGYGSLKLPKGLDSLPIMAKPFTQEQLADYLVTAMSSDRYVIRPSRRG